jgi:hypothetical protein
LQAKLDRLLALALGNTDAFVDAMPARRLIARLNGGPLIAVLQWNSSRPASTKTA